MKNFIIVSNSREPGAFEPASSLAIVRISEAELLLLKLAYDTAKRVDTSASELRLFGSNTDYYMELTADELLAKLPEEVSAALIEDYETSGYFFWPYDELDVDSLLGREVERMSVDLEEIVAVGERFQTNAECGDGAIVTSYDIPLAELLSEEQLKPMEPWVLVLRNSKPLGTFIVTKGTPGEITEATNGILAVMNMNEMYEAGNYGGSVVDIAARLNLSGFAVQLATTVELFE